MAGPTISVYSPSIFTSPTKNKSSIMPIFTTTHPVTPPLLPLSHGSPSSTKTYRTTRRISYTLKQRVNRYAYPILSISALLCISFFFFSYSHPQTFSSLTSYSEKLASHAKLQLYARESETRAREAREAREAARIKAQNGLSILDEDLGELIAEDDLFVQAYEEPLPKSAAEEDVEERFKSHREDVMEQDKKHALESLVWWLAEGGVLPKSWTVPNKAGLAQMGGKGFEKALDDLDMGENGESIFQEGWADYAKKQYRLVVFSKTYCPYSKKAKKILEEYRLTPAPFIIELDQRSDAQMLQSLLQQLTGRRTVPNVLLDFQSIGGSDEIALLHGEGGLRKTFRELEMLPGFRRRINMAKPPRLDLPEIPVNGPPKDGGKPIDLGPDAAPGDVVHSLGDQVPVLDKAGFIMVRDDEVEGRSDKARQNGRGSPNGIQDPARFGPASEQAAAAEMARLRARLAQLEAERLRAVQANNKLPPPPHLPPAPKNFKPMVDPLDAAKVAGMETEDLIGMNSPPSDHPEVNPQVGDLFPLGDQASDQKGSQHNANGEKQRVVINPVDIASPAQLPMIDKVIPTLEQTSSTEGGVKEDQVDTSATSEEKPAAKKDEKSEESKAVEIVDKVSEVKKADAAEAPIRADPKPDRRGSKGRVVG